ncbi:MAG: sulfotransferase domain-containing protein [Halioglobus sp.]
MKRIHIVGCPRSGTTLLMELMTTCYDSGGYCEHEVSIFEPVPVTEGAYLTKQPNDIKQIQHIFPADNNLHIIYLGRDPRAVITSKHRENPQQYFCNYRVWSECDQAALRYQDDARFLGLCYEDLVADADKVQATINRTFPFLSQRHLFSEYQHYAEPSAASARAMNGLRGVNLESLEKWRSHLPRIAEQLKRHPQLADDLIRLGYEPDQQWLSLLKGVDPVEFPCRYTERRPHLKEWEKSLRVYFKSRRYLRQQAGTVAPASLSR